VKQAPRRCATTHNHPEMAARFSGSYVSQRTECRQHNENNVSPCGPSEFLAPRMLDPTRRTDMKTNGNRFTYVSAQFVSAAALIATLTFSSGLVVADAHEDRAELRIKDMHTKLKITPAQEPQWAKVADVMQDNAKAMDTLTQARADHEKDMTAVDDLKSYGEIADAHADGIKKLVPSFAALYGSMSDAQKREADTLFRHGEHMHGEHKKGAKMMQKTN